MMGSGSQSKDNSDDGEIAKRSSNTTPEASNGPETSQMTVSSDEVNYLVFRYLQESGFVHSAFSFAHESMLSRTGLRSADKKVPPGALITFLRKGLQYVGIEENLRQEGMRGSRRGVSESEIDFSLLSPAAVTAISRRNPPIQLNVPPATAAAAVKAKLEAEAKIEAERSAAMVPSQLTPNGPLAPPLLAPQGVLEDPNASFARRALAAHAAAAHAAAMSQLQHMGQPVLADPFAQQRPAAADIMALQPGPRPAEGPETVDAATTLASVAVHGGKRAASGSKRSMKKQKKVKTTQDDSSPQGPSSAGLTTLEEAAAQLEANNESSREGSAQSMDIEENNQQAAAASGPAHLGEESRPLPVQDLINGQHERNGASPKESGKGLNGSPVDLPQNVSSEPEAEADPGDKETNASPDEILKLEMHQSEVFMCAWNPVFTDLIATGSGDASARIWQMRGMRASDGLETVKLLPHGSDPRDRKNKDVTTLEWSTDGTLLATGSYDGVARVWARNGALIHTLRGHNGPIFSLKWNKKGNYLLSGSYDKTTIVWDVSGSTGFVEQQFTDHEAPALDVDWKDNNTFASCSTDKTVHICRVGVSRPLKIYRGHTDEVNAVKWDPSGTYLASCSDDCTAKVWQVDSDRSDPLYDLKSHQQEIYTVKWSPTGQGSKNPSKKALLATASFDGSVRLWNIEDGSCYRVFRRHKDSVYSVAFSPSGDFLASGSLAGQMYIWNIEEDRHVKSYKGKGDIFEVAWNKEETRLAACFSSNVVAIIDFDRPSSAS